MKFTFQTVLISVLITATHQASLKSNTLKSKTTEVDATVTISHDLVVSMMNKRNQNSRKVSNFSRKTRNASFQSVRTAIPAMFFVRSRDQFADQISNDVDSVHNFLSSRRNRQRRRSGRKSAFSRLNRNNLDFTKFLQTGKFGQ